MKARRYDEILRARGYTLIENLRGNMDLPTTYKRIDVYEKKHKHNKIWCSVTIDSHGKAQEMKFSFIHSSSPDNMEEFKKIEIDRQYLYIEAMKIHEAFELLKVKKSPKYIYCF